MSRRTLNCQHGLIPTYRKHKQSGQAVVTVRSADGRRKDVLLGRYGSPESRAEYERVLAALRTAGGVPATGLRRAATPPAGLSVAEVLLAFVRHAAGHYRKADGTPTSEVKNFAQALRPLRELYGHTPAAEFGPLCLKRVRERMVAGGWCRGVVNKAVSRIKRAFRWAAAEELIDYETYNRLTTVVGLAKGRTAAREAKPVGPVDATTVRATLPYLSRPLRGMVEVMWLTGLRVGEAVRMTAGDIDRGAAVWLYSPADHKTGHRDRVRRVCLGHRAQLVLAPFIAAASHPSAYLFSPRQSEAERHAARRAVARRVRPKPPRVPVPTRGPGRCYLPHSLRWAITEGVKRANARRAGLAGHGDYDPVPRWHPHMLRHSFATMVRQHHGLEAAGAALGHAKMSATEIYAERDDGLASRLAHEIG